MLLRRRFLLLRERTGYRMVIKEGNLILILKGGGGELLSYVFICYERINISSSLSFSHAVRHVRG